jgi:hypothetical protein
MYRAHLAALYFMSGLTALPLTPPRVSAQEPGRFESRAALDLHYKTAVDDLIKRYIADLGSLAAKQSGSASEATYRHLFEVAVARQAYSAAEPAAEAILARPGAAHDLAILAHFTNVVAEAERGDFDESFTHLKQWIETTHPGQVPPDQRPPADIVIAIGDAYLGRLLAASRFDLAQKTCELAVANAATDDVKRHFAGWNDRIAMLDKPSPRIEAEDLDGLPVAIPAKPGTVTLVAFATPAAGPTASVELTRLLALADRYREKPFSLVGVCLAAPPPGLTAQDVHDSLRTYLIRHQCDWPVIAEGDGPGRVARAFAVTRTPASVIIDRTGKIVAIDLTPDALQKAIDRALTD